MLNISNHYVEEAKASQKACEIRHKEAQEALVRANQGLRVAIDNVSVAKNCPELKKVSKKFKAMIAFPTPHGVYVQLGNVLPENAEKIKQYLEVEMEFKPEVMGGGSVIYYSPAGHQYFVRYL